MQESEDHHNNSKDDVRRRVEDVTTRIRVILRILFYNSTVQNAPKNHEEYEYSTKARIQAEEKEEFVVIESYCVIHPRAEMIKFNWRRKKGVGGGESRAGGEAKLDVGLEVSYRHNDRSRCRAELLVV